ncbi:MAG: glycosyltransferase family 2 protein [Candidatus Aureabacteria bacterium]|nr:glycosyltransferase family 2 protein [Candidatus Auribacterota bacterium]
MLNNRKIVVVLPAYKAEATLKQTYTEIDHCVVDEVILVDDASDDRTVEIAKELGLKVFVHEKNQGYGGNQKTCYREALKLNADIVIMLHPDYQYTPKLLIAMASMLAYGQYDMVLASRILVKGALKGGMPLYKYIANRFLTYFENLCLGVKLSEYHTGYRAYTSQLLKTIPFEKNSNDFVFDNQLIVQAVHRQFQIGEISCPAKYFQEASSINFRRSVKYGFGVLLCAIAFLLHRTGIKKISWLK